MTYNITRKQTHSKLPSGTFSLLRTSDNIVAKIAYNADAQTLQQSLQSMDPTFTVVLELKIYTIVFKSSYILSIIT
jgi:hypothetical protein